ncbi:hypothetical protein ACLB2K_027443 [Fragaria x ananassa]
MCTTTSKRRSKRRRLSSELCTNTITTPTPRPNWSDLQPDLLELIFEKLPAEDAIRFPAVCHFWELAAKSSVSFTIPHTHPCRNNHRCSYSLVKTCLADSCSALQGKRIELPPITDQHRLPVHRAAISADPSRNNNFVVLSVVSSDRIVVWDFREKPDSTKNEDFPTITKDFQISGLKIERHWNMSTYRLESQGDIILIDEDKTWGKEIYEKSKKSKDPSRNMAEIRILQYNLEDKKKPKVYEKFKVKEADHYPPRPWILPNPVLHGEKKHKSSETEAD